MLIIALLAGFIAGFIAGMIKVLHSQTWVKEWLEEMRLFAAEMISAAHELDWNFTPAKEAQ